MLSINKAIYLEDTFCYRDCVPSVKTATYVCNRFNFSFCARNHKKKTGYIKFKSKMLKQMKPTNQIKYFFGRSLF